LSVNQGGRSAAKSDWFMQWLLDSLLVGMRSHQGITFTSDGSLTLSLGHAEPEDRSNWLPAPAGAFYLITRLYGAKPEVAEGKWTLPPIKQA